MTIDMYKVVLFAFVLMGKSIIFSMVFSIKDRRLIGLYDLGLSLVLFPVLEMNITLTSLHQYKIDLMAVLTKYTCQKG